MAEPVAVTIYTDGACSGNPGPAGAGYVILNENGQIVAEGSVPIGRATNNIAEYQGAISGLENASTIGARQVTVRSDSELMCKQIWGQYRIKNKNLMQLHVQLRRLMEGFDRVVFEHVPRKNNERADALAREAVRQAKQRLQ